MTRFILLITVIFGWVTGGFSQVTITNSVIPSLGDSLERMQDNQPLGVSIGMPGSDQAWDFSSLQGPFVITTVLQHPNEGSNFSSFPQADLLIKEGNIESYYHRSQTDYSLIGVAAPFPELQLSNVAGRYTPPLPVISTPINYQAFYSQNSNFRVTFSTTSLPAELIEQLPLQPDSMRLNQINAVSSVADAWGTLRLPAGEFEVLRVRRQVDISHKIEALLPFLGWQDVTTLLAQLIGDFLEDREIVLYEYYANNVKGPVAVVTMDQDNVNEINNVSFFPGNMPTSVRYRDNGRADAYAYPNPSMGYLRIQMVNMPEDTYTLYVYNILGKEIYRKNNIRANGSKILELGLYDQPKGTYLFSIKNSRGQNLMSKRFILIKP